MEGILLTITSKRSGIPDLLFFRLGFGGLAQDECNQERNEANAVEEDKS